MTRPCPHCGAVALAPVPLVRRITSALGCATGLALAYRAGRGVKNIVAATLSGLSLGASIGEAIDENVVCRFRCQACGFKPPA